jgi:hypothetical protein
MNTKTSETNINILKNTSVAEDKNEFQEAVSTLESVNGNIKDGNLPI